MNTGGIIAGIFFSLLGVFLIVFSLFGNLFLLIYGIPIFIIGIWMIFNKNEDRVEPIRKSFKRPKMAERRSRK